MYKYKEGNNFNNKKFETKELNITYNKNDLRKIIINHLKNFTDANPEEVEVLSLETEWLMLKQFYKKYLTEREYETFLKVFRIITKLNLNKRKTTSFAKKDIGERTF